MSACIILALPLPVWSKFIVVAFIAASAWHYVRRYAPLAAPHAVRELKLTSNSNLEIFQNEWKTAELVGE